MIRMLAVTLATTAVLVTSAGGQQPTYAQSTSFRDKLRAGDVTAAARLVDQQCGWLLASSRETDEKVSERADRAREAMDCARMTAAEGVALVPPERSPQTSALLDALLDAYRRNLEIQESENQFLGVRWGLGVGFSRSLSATVDDASIVNGVVRQISDTREQPRALLEYHKLFWCNDGRRVGTRGCGPFVAVAARESKILSGVGFGLVYGQKTSPTEPEGFSIGFGAVLDANVRDLGDGFVLNQAAPDGETSVRFISKSRWSTLFFVTRNF